MAHDAVAATVFAPLVSRIPATRVFDVRAVHARVLWENGWGGGRFPTFDSYAATIPRVPSMPATGRFGTLVLVDTSVPLTDACRMLGIAYGGDDALFNVHGDTRRTPAVYWMWVNVGEETAGQPARLVRETLPRTEHALTALELVALYASSPHLVTPERSLNAAASRIGSFPAYCGCLMLVSGMPELGVAEYCAGSPARVTPTRWG